MARYWHLKDYHHHVEDALSISRWWPGIISVSLCVKLPQGVCSILPSTLRCLEQSSTLALLLSILSSPWIHIFLPQSSSPWCCLLHQMCHGPNGMTSPTRVAALLLAAKPSSGAILGFMGGRTGGPVRCDSCIKDRSTSSSACTHGPWRSSCILTMCPCTQVPVSPSEALAWVGLQECFRPATAKMTPYQAANTSHGHHYSHCSSIMEPPDRVEAKQEGTNRWSVYSLVLYVQHHSIITHPLASFPSPRMPVSEPSHPGLCSCLCTSLTELESPLPQLFPFWSSDSSTMPGLVFSRYS